MGALFGGPPHPPALPPTAAPQNTATNAEMAALARRQGSQAAMLTKPGDMQATNILGKQLLGQ